MGEELKRASDLVAAENFQMSGAWSDAEFARRVGRYEAIFEPLAKIFAVLGRWGGAREFKTVKEVIASLADQETIGGLLAFVALRSYPVMLLAYAFGLGALRAGQLSRLYSLFQIPTPDRHGKRGVLVSDLFLDVWEGGKNDYWN